MFAYEKLNEFKIKRIILKWITFLKKRIFEKGECCYKRIITSTSIFIVWLISACVIQTFFEWNHKKNWSNYVCGYYALLFIKGHPGTIDRGWRHLNGPTTPMMKEYFIVIIQSSMNSRHNGTFISHSNGIKFYTRRFDALKVNQMPFENQITRLIRTIRTLCSHLLLSLNVPLSFLLVFCWHGVSAFFLINM